jgi:O-antigen/teichoic acid export membrane protein
VDSAPPHAATSEADRAAGVRKLVLRNAGFTAISQIAGTPLSLLVTAISARYLGATQLGYLYLATTFNSFAFLAVDWGQLGALPALVAADRSQAGRLLGTSLVWRGFASIVAAVALGIGCHLLGYSREIVIAVAIASAGCAMSALASACTFTILGFERTDVAAARTVIENVVTLVIVVPILVLGGKVGMTLVGHALAAAVLFAYVWRSLRLVAVGRLSFDVAALRQLFQRGTPFLWLGVAMVLQPYVDALFLSRLGTAEAVGWHAAAKKLIGVLVFPCSAMIGALYPTLCRLHATDRQGAITATTDSMRATTLLVMPVALGCALFPDIGIALYSRRSFGPAEDNLRVMSLFLMLMYFTMPMGVFVTSSGRSRAWAIVQSLCVGVSLVLDPILVPWFQHRTGNGGLGVCWASVVSEVIVIALAVCLVPRSAFDRRFWRTLFLAGVAGLSMLAVARVLRGWSSFLVAPIAVVAYVTTLWLTGGIERDQVRRIREFVQRKISGRSGAPRVSSST